MKSPHPNWGHPTLRWIKHKKKFKTLEELQLLLGKLHEEYPMSSIPLNNRLEIYVYSRGKDKTENPIKKYFFVISQQDDGLWFIDAKEKKEKKVIDKAEKESSPQKIGHFTKLVIAKREKKKKK